MDEMSKGLIRDAVLDIYTATGGLQRGYLPKAVEEVMSILCDAIEPKKEMIRQILKLSLVDIDGSIPEGDDLLYILEEEIGVLFAGFDIMCLMGDEEQKVEGVRGKVLATEAMRVIQEGV